MPKPWAMAVILVSTTVTGRSPNPLVMCAEPTVPDYFADRCTETIPSSPTSRRTG